MNRLGLSVAVFGALMCGLAAGADPEEVEPLPNTGLVWNADSDETWILRADIVSSVESAGSRLVSRKVRETTPLSPEEARTLSSVQPLERAKGPSQDFIPFSVIGKDKRKAILDTTQYPNSAVVQFYFEVPSEEGFFGCSGAMISESVLLTAGHCVMSAGRWHRNFVIYPGRNAAVAPFGSCKIKRVFALAGWGRPISDVDASDHDLGAIQLDCDVGLRTGWFGVGIFEEERSPSTSLLGYPCDLTPAGRQYVSKDKVRGQTDHRVYYKNDTFGCQSGAPVFVGKEDATVRLIHTQGAPDSGNWRKHNSGVKITQEKLDVLHAWIASLEGRTGE